jgi:hypothetical protein
LDGTQVFRDASTSTRDRVSCNATWEGCKNRRHQASCDIFLFRGYDHVSRNKHGACVSGGECMHRRNRPIHDSLPAGQYELRTSTVESRNLGVKHSTQGDVATCRLRRRSVYMV